MELWVGRTTKEDYIIENKILCIVHSPFINTDAVNLRTIAYVVEIRNKNKTNIGLPVLNDNVETKNIWNKILFLVKFKE